MAQWDEILFNPILHDFINYYVKAGGVYFYLLRDSEGSNGSTETTSASYEGGIRTKVCLPVKRSIKLKEKKALHPSQKWLNKYVT